MREATKKTTTRRDLMGAAGFTALAGVAAVAIARPEAQAVEVLPTAHNSDAELIAIGREAADLIEQRKPWEVRWWALPSSAGSNRKGTPSYDDELNTVSGAIILIDDRLTELSDQALELRATTREGQIAKAHLIRHEMKVEYITNGVLEHDMMQPHDKIVWSLLEDMLGVTV